MKKIQEWMLKQLNKYSIKKKMLIIQLFCVVLPLLITDSIILSIIVSSERKVDMQEMNNIADSVTYTLISECDLSLKKVQEIYISSDINAFIKSRFDSPLDYYQKYYELGKKVNNGNMAAVIYTDAEGIISGGSFQSTDKVIDEEWYQDFIEADTSIRLVADFEKVNGEMHRTMFFLRRMDYFNSRERNNVLKLYIDYNNIARTISNSKYSSIVYVCKDDNILFSNDGKGGIYTEYGKISDDIVSNAVVDKSVELYGDQWNIYVMPGEKIVTNALKNNATLLILLIVFNILFPSLISGLINKSITERIFALQTALQNNERGGLYTLSEISGSDEISELLLSYNDMADRLNNLIDNEYKNKLIKQESDLARQRAELLALHSQINPHFLFNALESIRMHSVIKHENETAQMIEKLALMQRQNVEWGNDQVSLKDEVRFAEAFLELQKYRFGDKLKYEIRIDDECKDFKVPKLSLVTFVENACVHGMENKTSACWVFVRIAKEFENVILEIEDTGSGMHEEMCRKLMEDINSVQMEMLQDNQRRVGILNAALRLKMLYKDTRFEIDSEIGAGTMVTITIPCEGEVC